MELYDAMSTLRAVRRLRPDPIPADVLERVLQAGCWAPTGGNTQPWKVVVATDPEIKAGLKEIYHPLWGRYRDSMLKRLEDQPEAAAEAWRRVVKAGDYLADNLHDAPRRARACRLSGGTRPWPHHPQGN